MNVNEIKDKIIKYGSMLFRQGLSPYTSGNISVRCDENFLITGTGTCLGDLNYDNIVLINAFGEVIDNGMKPSSEYQLHIKIYERRKDVNAIIHCHSPFATAFAVSNKAMTEPILPDFVYNFDTVQITPYATPGTKELSEITSSALVNSNAVIMANHGIIACSDSIQTAFYKIDLIENYAKIFIYSSSLGNVRCLNDESVETIRLMK